MDWATTARPQQHVARGKNLSNYASILIEAMGGRQYSIYTDGSFKSLPTAEEALFSEVAIKSKHGASMVFMPSAIGAPPIVLHMAHDDHLGADCAFPMELVPLTLALEIACVADVAAIYSDCKSIVMWLDKSRPRLSHTRCTSLLMVAADLKRLTSVRILHCDAHAERRKQRAQWSAQDIGNYTADRAADKDLDSIFQEHEQFAFY